MRPQDLLSVNVSWAGRLDANQTSRVFAASISLRTPLLQKISIDLTCTAPVEAFALLEKEGST